MQLTNRNKRGIHNNQLIPITSGYSPNPQQNRRKDNMTLYSECRINKNAFLQTAYFGDFAQGSLRFA